MSKVDPGLIRELLLQLGEDPRREGLLETPARVAKAFDVLTSGYNANIAALLKTFPQEGHTYDQMVFLGSIPVYSMCEHHMAPFFGVAHVAYIPGQAIVGLSKLARLVKVFCRRLQVQERITDQVADALEEHLKPRGVGVVLRCRHLCMESRGVECHGASTSSSALRGAMACDAASRAEFMQFVHAEQVTKV